ncbi:hypothetical protein [Sphingobacterium kitahiroshimense]|uniref:Secreted protein n=1 Tax=Sphingobacterium kitahiroshimense TaxID=470446 RepID=A0ABV0BVV9_9SPHI
MKNLKTHIGIILLFCLGFLFLPSTGYSCDMDHTNIQQASSAQEHQSTHSKTNNSCSENASKKADHGDCNHSKCDHVTCRCLSSSCSVFLTIPFDINLKEFSFVAKQKFGFQQNNYYSEFSSIWLPPKIG